MSSLEKSSALSISLFSLGSCVQPKKQPVLVSLASKCKVWRSFYGVRLPYQASCLIEAQTVHKVLYILSRECSYLRGKKATSRGGQSQSHSKSYSAKSLKRNLSKNSSVSKGSRGRPRKPVTDLLCNFQRATGSPPTLEEVRTCIIRRLLRKIETRAEGTDGRDKKTNSDQRIHSRS
jgi:hypothetical protein